jgi:CRP-like cAMP-binding protein
MHRPSPPRNRLLASLPDGTWDRVAPHLQEVPLPLGHALYEVEDRIDRLYFPTAGVISTVAVFEGGATAEMATTGREGMIAVDVVLGGDTALARFLVQVPGSALMIGIEPFRRLQAEVPGFAAMLLAYARAYLAQLQQSVACNGVHSLEERAARWLLMMRNRSDGSFPLTQEILAQMLGASRTAVNLTARSLQRAGLISYRRGIIRILDHGGLEDLSCECYRIVHRDFERRFGAQSAG